jgi:hypothetical protein
MSRSDFTTVRVVGGLLPTDLLGRVLARDKDLGGLAGADYHLAAGETPREAANRAWPYLLGAWTTYRQALAKLPQGDRAVGLTRDKWLNALFKELDYGRLQPTPAGGLTADDKSFPVSHLWDATPLHLLGWGVELDKRTKGVPGAAERAPQAMLQELLNRSDDYLWGMLSNGRTLRLLRDSTSLAGQSYVEFDLESMFDGEVFSDFVLLYLLLHQSRVKFSDGGIPADCWLEKWRTSAAETGTRALGLLRDGVKDALEALGSGFLQTPGNDLNERLAAGTLRLEDYQRSLLRLVYRLLFLFVSEDRGLLLDPNADPLAVRRYQDYYSTGRLRALARKRRGARHVDQWQGLQLVIDALGREGGLPQLGLPGLGGIFAPEPVDVVMGQRLPNEALLTAVRKLSVVYPKGSPPRIVDYRNLGAEELGSIYESLLELVPRHDQLERTFTLELLAGNDRKTSGSYYTPTSLIDLVLDEALDPLLDERERQGEEALLSMTVCDPACGSGHFLVAAARRIATRLAMVRTGEADPTPADVQQALHDVVARCIYGVDLNPMAAELAKVSLWLEAMEPGRPLGFLDAHIKVGNALLGTTPRLISEGIPDAAFDRIEGDDKKYAASLKKRNKAERDQRLSGHHQGGLFDETSIDVSNAHLRARYTEAVSLGLQAVDLTQLAAAQRRYHDAQDSPEARRARLVADTWCAAFVQVQQPGAVAITQETVEQAASDSLGADTEMEVDRLAAAYRFFHWQLEFPDVFSVPDGAPYPTVTGWSGGFAAMFGNPPWETVQVSEREFFASRDEEVANGRTAAIRKRLISNLVQTNPALFEDFRRESRRSQAENKLVRGSGRYPLCARGKINTYSIFAELFRDSIHEDGRMGIITPTGLMTDATTADFAADVLTSKRLVAFYDFANHKRRLFVGLKGQSWFGISVITGGRRVEQPNLAFDLAGVDEMVGRRFSLDAMEILLVNPNTGTLPVFRSKADAEIVLGVYERVPVLYAEQGVHENPWGVTFSQGPFNMASDSGLFRTQSDLRSLGATFDDWAWGRGTDRWLPLYEGKMFGLWNDRFGTYAGQELTDGSGVRSIPRATAADLDDPRFEPVARYWVSESAVADALKARATEDWLFAWRDITNTTNERTFVASVLPRSAVGDTAQLLFFDRRELMPSLLATFSSIVFDYISRQKMSGTHMTWFMVKQLPVPSPQTFECPPAWQGIRLFDWIASRVVELAFTSYRIAPFARDLGDDGLPFRWIPERREVIQAELDAAMMHVYGLTHDEVEHVVDSFTTLCNHEEHHYGEFRTKRLVLAEYDRMAEAAATGVPYESSLDPAPGFGPRHDASTIPDWFKEQT